MLDKPNHTAIMHKMVYKTAFYVVATGILVGLASCENNFKEVQKSVITEFTPSGEADTINLKYTDSGKIKSELIARKMLDYGTVKYPFTEFPLGLNITMYDPAGKKTNIVANYGISYKESGLIDLRGNVKVTSHDGQIFETNQLYFDQKNELFFTDENYKFTDAKANSIGEGVDFRKDLKIIQSQRISGQIKSDKKL